MAVTVARAFTAQRDSHRSSTPKPEPLALRVLEWCVIAAALAALSVGIAIHWPDVRHELPGVVAWIPIVIAADLMPVTLWNSVQLTMSLPILLAAAMVYAPPTAALLGFVCTVDLREVRGEIGFLRGFFNRSHIALSVLLASVVFHGTGGDVARWPLVVLAGLSALGVDMLLNNGLIVFGHHLLTGEALPRAIRNVYGRGRPLPFLLGYVCFGLLALLLATVYWSAGNWGLVVFAIPIFLARQMFEQSRRLLEASKALVAKDRLLLRISERIADERRDERLTVAADLHDEVLPPLYKVHLLGEVLRQDLATGRLLELEDDLPGLLEATSRASEAIRVLIRDLRKSPLGPNGVSGTLALLARQLESESRIRIELEADEVVAAPLVQLLTYQVAREAMVNAVRHSGATRILVALTQEEGHVRLVVRDNGHGFAPSTVDGDSHFGLQLMRERVELVGGILQLSSAYGEGTEVVVRLPGDISPAQD